MSLSSAIPVNEKGEYTRPPAAFRDQVTADGSSGFPAEAGRYHLYMALSCPFAGRVLTGRALKGLEDTISVGEVDPHMELGGRGWRFTEDFPDVVYGKSTLKEIYQLAREGYDGKASVPVLWDKKTKTIVNNESSEILRMITSGVFDKFCATPEQKTLNLYPKHLQKQIDEINAFTHENVNNGVYKAGFASTQEAYDEASKKVFAAMDKLEKILSEQRYLVGNTITEADVRLITSLLRFDNVYHSLFKCNRKMLVQYPNLWDYTRDIYQLPGVASVVSLDSIKTTYWGSMPHLNPSGIIPHGPGIDFSLPHTRQKLSHK